MRYLFLYKNLEISIKQNEIPDNSPSFYVDFLVAQSWLYKYFDFEKCSCTKSQNLLPIGMKTRVYQVVVRGTVIEGKIMQY